MQCFSIHNRLSGEWTVGSPVIDQKYLDIVLAFHGETSAKLKRRKTEACGGFQSHKMHLCDVSEPIHCRRIVYIAVVNGRIYYELEALGISIAECSGLGKVQPSLSRRLFSKFGYSRGPDDPGFPEG